MTPSKRLTVTAIVNKDNKITAFFNEIPAILVQGDSMDDVKGKALNVLTSYIRRLDSIKENIDIQTKSLA